MLVKTKKNKIFLIFLLFIIGGMFFLSCFINEKNLNRNPDRFIDNYVSDSISNEGKFLYKENQYMNKYNNTFFSKTKPIKVNETFYDIPSGFYGIPMTFGVISLIVGRNFHNILYSIFFLFFSLSLLIFLLNNENIEKEKISFLKIIAILFSPAIFYFLFPNSEMIGIFFILCTLISLTHKNFLLTGFFFGISFIFRPPFLFLILLPLFLIYKGNKKPKNELFKKRYKKEFTLFFISFIIIFVTFLLINKTLYDSPFILGQYYDYSFSEEKINENFNFFQEIMFTLNIFFKNVPGNFSYLLENISFLPTIVIFGSPFLLIFIFYCPIYILVSIIPYFLYFLSKPWWGYGSQWAMQSTLSSPIRYLSVFFIIILLVSKFNLDKKIKKITFLLIFFLSILLIFSQQNFSFPSVYSEQKVFAEQFNQSFQDQIKKGDIFITDYFHSFLPFDANVYDIRVSDDLGINETKKDEMINRTIKDIDLFLTNNETIFIIPYEEEGIFLVNEIKKEYKLNPTLKNIQQYRGPMKGNINHTVTFYEIVSK